MDCRKSLGQCVQQTTLLSDALGARSETKESPRRCGDLVDAQFIAPPTLRGDFCYGMTALKRHDDFDVGVVKCPAVEGACPIAPSGQCEVKQPNRDKGMWQVFSFDHGTKYPCSTPI